MSEFHEGELAVQQLAGVRAEADRLSGMLAPPHLGGASTVSYTHLTLPTN